MFQRHKIVNYIQNLRNASTRKYALIEKPVREMSDAEKEEVIAAQKQLITTQHRIETGLSLNHPIFVEKTFKEILGGSLYYGDLKAKDRQFCGKFNEGRNPCRLLWHPIQPERIVGFMNIKDDYQYYRLTKITVHFQSTSSSNIAPIIGRYVAPFSGDFDDKEIFPDARMRILQEQATQEAKSQNNREAKMSLSNPYYMIDFIVDGKRIRSPVIQNGLLACSYDMNASKVNFGQFVFESRCPEIQEIYLEVYYTIEFYTSVNMEGVKE